AKADLVLIDLANPWMMPVRDPLRSLVFHAADRAVRAVWIDGGRVVDGGRVLTLDRAGALERLAPAPAGVEGAPPPPPPPAPRPPPHRARRPPPPPAAPRAAH